MGQFNYIWAMQIFTLATYWKVTSSTVSQLHEYICYKDIKTFIKVVEIKI